MHFLVKLVLYWPIINFIKTINFKISCRKLLILDKIFLNYTVGLLFVRTIIMSIYQSGPPREILPGGTRLLWGPGNRLRLLSKLRLVENYLKKIKIKRLWLRLRGPSEIHMPLLGSPGRGPIYRLNPHS